MKYLLGSINNFINLFLFFKFNKKGIFMMAFTMAIFAFFFVPANSSYDIYRLHNIYYNIENINYMLKKDVILYIIFIFFRKLNLPAECLNFLSQFIIYYFYFKSLYIINNENPFSKKEYRYFYFTFFISIPIFSFVGIRFGMATSFFIYGLVLDYKKKFSGLYFFILAILTHYSLIFGVIIYFISKKINNLLILKIIFLISIVLAFIIPCIDFVKIINYFENFEYIASKLNAYMGERINKIQGKNILYFIQKIQVLYQQVICIILFNKLKSKNKFKSIIFLLMSFYFITTNISLSLSSRYFKILILLLNIYFLVNIKENKILYKNIEYKIIKLYLVIFYVFFILLRYRESFFISYYKFYNINFYNMVYKIITYMMR